MTATLVGCDLLEPLLNQDFAVALISPLFLMLQDVLTWWDGATCRVQGCCMGGVCVCFLIVLDFFKFAVFSY